MRLIRHGWSARILRQQTATGSESDLWLGLSLSQKLMSEEFSEAKEQDFQSAPKSFWQTVWQLRRGKRQSGVVVPLFKKGDQRVWVPSTGGSYS